MPVATVNDIELNFLAAGYRVLRSDNRGSGASATPAGPYTSRMLADDARALGVVPAGQVCGRSTAG